MVDEYGDGFLKGERSRWWIGIMGHPCYGGDKMLDVAVVRNVRRTWRDGGSLNMLLRWSQHGSSTE